MQTSAVAESAAFTVTVSMTNRNRSRFLTVYPAAFHSWMRALLRSSRGPARVAASEATSHCGIATKQAEKSSVAALMSTRADASAAAAGFCAVVAATLVEFVVGVAEVGTAVVGEVTGVGGALAGTEDVTGADVVVTDALELQAAATTAAHMTAPTRPALRLRRCRSPAIRLLAIACDLRSIRPSPQRHCGHDVFL